MSDKAAHLLRVLSDIVLGVSPETFRKFVGQSGFVGLVPRPAFPSNHGIQGNESLIPPTKKIIPRSISPWDFSRADISA